MSYDEVSNLQGEFDDVELSESSKADSDVNGHVGPGDLTGCGECSGHRSQPMNAAAHFR